MIVAINPNKNKVYIATTNETKNSANIAIMDCSTDRITEKITLPNTIHPQLVLIINQTRSMYQILALISLQL